MLTKELDKQISKINRIKFANLPTPLHECPTLSKALNIKKLFIKREDLTGLAFGGNKVRHLEFRFGYIKKHNFDIIVNANMGVSNNARLWAAAANINNIKLVNIMSKELKTEMQGNHLLNHLMNIKIIYSDTTNEQILQQEAITYGNKLKKLGYKPYITVAEQYNEVAAIISYLNTALELNNQFQKLGLKKIHIFQASGSSYLGLALAKKILNFTHWKITGIAPRLQPRMRNIREITNKALNYLNKRSNNKLKSDFLDYKDLNWDLSFYGQGYGIPTKKCIDAIKLVAEREAIFLDPIYTGKAMSGLIEYANSKKIDRDSSVVFIHSGGTPNLFTYSNELLSDLQSH